LNALLPPGRLDKIRERKVGAWGSGPFENDDASDFVYELASAGPPGLRAALEEATSLDPGACLEAAQAFRAVAAAEVTAALNCAPAVWLPPDVADLVRALPPSDRSFRLLARQAVDRVVTNSELKDLWDESPLASDWRESLARLRQRLG
jgi:hypothetical protein